ncbi:unnamed protein product [Heligmosomoides polygyrus]|uniref:CASP-like protein n=1 Tax=Heligmosomoides polygyrus TaxID=6339 RepID=A0A183FRF8_HELPZ|nr:unnamed protein product [Heligmosomoides polygyrus]
METKMLRWTAGVTRMDRIRKDAIQQKFGVVPIADKMREARLRCSKRCHSAEHGVILSASSVLCAFCTFLSMQSSEDVGKFAFKAHPKQFQEASHWYFTRLRASAILFTAESVLQLIVLSVLYLGIQCRYRSFAQLPQKPEIVMRGGNLFA